MCEFDVCPYSSKPLPSPSTGLVFESSWVSIRAYLLQMGVLHHDDDDDDDDVVQNSTDNRKNFNMKPD